MRLLIRKICGRTPSRDYLINRPFIVKPRVVGEADGYYLSEDGKLFEKKRFDELFNPPKSKIKKSSKGENPDKTREWMK